MKETWSQLIQLHKINKQPNQEIKTITKKEEILSSTVLKNGAWQRNIKISH